MPAAMAELTSRWRAEALAEHAARFETRAAALVTSFETGAAHLATLRASQAAIGAEQARRARAVAGFCRSRPAPLDRPEHEVGAAAAATRATRPAALTPVSEWAVDELAVALQLTEASTTRLAVVSLDLVDRLPRTLDALEQGLLAWEHAVVLSEVVAPLDDEVRVLAEQRLLDRLGRKTPAQLRAAAHRVVQRLDAEAVSRRVAAALRERHVAVHPTGDGLGTLSVTDLPLPVLRAVEDALRRYADAGATPGDQRTRTQRMVDCLVDLVLRPGEHGLAPVQAQLTVVATVGTLLGTADEPGEVDGDLVPAEVVRRLAQSLGLLPADEPTGPEPPSPKPTNPEPTDGGPTGTEPTGIEPMSIESMDTESMDAGPTGTEVTGDEVTGDEVSGTGVINTRVTGDMANDPEPASTKESDPEAVSIGASNPEPTGPAATVGEPAVSPATAATTSGLAALLGVRTVTDTALAHRPHIALVDELTGQLLALTDAAGLRAGRALGPPPEADGYSPSDPLDRFVRLRDRRCRFPGCRQRPVRSDLDHTVPYPLGPTSADNLTCLCRHHHRLSHQAPGWMLRGLPDGGLEWTTPTGDVQVTRPPGFGTDDGLPPAGGPAAPLRAGSGTSRPDDRPPVAPPSDDTPPPPPDDGPPPF